jgi:hypothetical protein
MNSEYRLDSLAAGPYNETPYRLQQSTRDQYAQASVPPDTSTWYKTVTRCLKRDPTLVARYHTFPDAPIPDGVPNDPAAAAQICYSYRTAWPMEVIDSSASVEAERNHPTLGFGVGAPVTSAQIAVESRLRRLDQPLTKCQMTISEDAPLHRNTVAPPVPYGMPPGVQNASNPVAVLVIPGADECRRTSDEVVGAMSGRRFNNPTRQDTMRMDRPFAPPGIGSGSSRGAEAPSKLAPYYA